MPENRRSALDARRRRVAARRVAEVQSGRTAETRTRQQQELLRAARRPPAAYGVAVRRRLRARWFDLVPVRRRDLTAFYLVLAGLASLLVGAHWLSLRVEPLAAQPRLAHPLRLDLPGGIGDWAGAQLLSLAAGASFLVYQLRRHRGDDYRGRYRMWRPVILLLGVASLDAVARVRDVPAALFDAFMPDPQIIAGDDAARLALLLLGSLLAVPLVAEMRRCPGGGVLVLVGLAAMAVPTAVRLDLVTAASDVGGLWAGGSLLVGRACILAAAITYLRRVFIEVHATAGARQDGEGSSRLGQQDSRPWRLPRISRERLGQMLRRNRATDSSEETGEAKQTRKTKKASARQAAVEESEEDPAAERPRWWHRGLLRRGRPRTRDATAEEARAPNRAADDPQENADGYDAPGGETAAAAETAEDAPGRAKRRLRLGWRKRKPQEAVEPNGGEAEDETDDAENGASQAVHARSAGWLKRMRRGRAGTQAEGASGAGDDAQDVSHDEVDAAGAKPARTGRRWLSLRRGRRDQAADEPHDGSPQQPEETEPAPLENRSPADGAPRDAHHEHPATEADTEDGIDLSKVSKAERRRIRKQMRREGRAA